MAEKKMREIFIEKNFSKGSLEIIEKANIILSEYESQGLVLTLRQLYYQFVARGFISNRQTEYKRIGSIISDARLAGLIDWAMMEDRTRYIRKLTDWEDPLQIMHAVTKQYREDLWRTQSYRPEVWIEKDALVGVIERACNDLRVPYFACRGYASQSSQYEAGQRFRSAVMKKQRPIVFHFGDHDPSGMDMTRDNEDRLAMFTRHHVKVKRLALNWAQIERYSPPPNPAKETDSRSGPYIQQFGNESWELDALEPTIIDQLIRDNITQLIDQSAWKEVQESEEENRQKLVDACRCL